MGDNLDAEEYVYKKEVIRFMCNKVTIAIASYNNGQFIERCIDSVINQSYRQLDILVVDDGSIDDTLSRINKYKADRRVRTIVKENGGLSSVRQVCLAEAIGDYICFIDADDYLEPTSVELMLTKMISEDSDICVSSTAFVDEEGKLILFWKMDETSRAIKLSLNEITNPRSKYARELYLSDSWNKMYRIEFLRNSGVVFCMPKGLNGTDTLFNHAIALHLPSYSKIKDVCYIHVMYNHSAVHRKHKDLQESFRIITKYLIEESNRLAIEDKMNSSLTSFYYKGLFDAYKDIYEEYNGEDLQHEYEILYNKHMYNIEELGVIDKRVRDIGSISLWMFRFLLKHKRSFMPFFIKIAIKF